MDPLILRRMRFQQATPFAQAIGLELVDWGIGHARTRLAPAPPVQRTPHDAALHHLALIGMADQTLSYAFTAAIGADAGLSTIDLRVDFGAPPQGAVMAQAQLQHHTAQNGLATLTAQDAAGQAVLAACALFNFRAFPGGGGMKRPDLPPFVNDHAGPFADFLGLSQADGVTSMAGGVRRLVGFEGLPALHGGVIGALLAACCDAAQSAVAPKLRLATLQVRYMRPAGLAPLFARATCVRAGRSAAFFNATCFHTEGVVVADAQANFAPSPACT